MKIITIALIVGVISGCATTNEYISNYSQVQDVDSIPGVVKLQQGHEPIVAITEDMNGSLDILKSEKFEVIGYSSFNGPYEDYKNAIVQAKAIEATHVLISVKHTGNQTEKQQGPASNALISGVVGSATPGGAPVAGSNLASNVSTESKLFYQEAKYLVKSNSK